MNPSLPGDFRFEVALSAFNSYCSAMIPSVVSDCSCDSLVTILQRTRVSHTRLDQNQLVVLKCINLHIVSSAHSVWILYHSGSSLGCGSLYCCNLAFPCLEKYHVDFAPSSCHLPLHLIGVTLILSSWI